LVQEVSDGGGVTSQARLYRMTEGKEAFDIDIDIDMLAGCGGTRISRSR
jgi:hypothetical protein